MNSLAHRPRLRRKVKHILFSTMLCCGKRKETRGAEVVDPLQLAVMRPQRGIVVQPDFRRVSGLSSAVFRQLEAVERAHDASTAAAIDRIENRGGEMMIRMLDPATLGRAGADAYRQGMAAQDSAHVVRFVEIVKRPGQTLGLYIREGDGLRATEGVFISRIALESAVYNSGLLRVGDEVLAVNLVDVRRMSLDDVVIVMSIPRRLVLTVRSRILSGGQRVRDLQRRPAPDPRPPVVVIKKDTSDDRSNGENSENGHLIRARTKGLPPEIPAIAVKLSEKDHQRERHRYDQPMKTPEDLYYSSGAPHRPSHIPHHHHPYHQPPPTHQQYAASRRREEQTQATPRWVVTDQPTATYSQPPESIDRGHALQQEEIEVREPTLERYHHRRTRSLIPPSRGTGYERIESTTPLRRSTGMLRTESDYRMPPPPTSRRSFRVPPTLGHRGRVRRYDDTPRLGGILRRGRDLDSYASDTEAQDSYWTMRRGPYSGRSHSLPRSMRAGGFGGRGHQAVRFTSSLPYDSQEESDGAVSAPELPATSSLRRPPPTSGRRGVFTSNEYRAWMRRAPSTGALYERLKKDHPQLTRVAYSAESILDTARQEDYRGIYTFPRRLTTPSDDSMGGGAYTARRRSVPHPTPVKPSEDRLRLLSLDPREFDKYRPRPSTATGSAFSGLLWLHLLSGRGLRPTGSGGEHFRDLYCVIECDRAHRARTVVRTGEHSFDWDEVFEIDLVENREIAFLLYTWDPRFRHKLCYKGVLQLGALLRERAAHSLALRLEPRGTLFLKLRWRTPRSAFQRRPAPDASGGPLFGVALAAVLRREDSGFGVPLLVKRCTEEVERRGLDVVGIYRLCGSALRKRLLRDDFERSARLADLTVEAVPDVNVVTSVLKDYLRELPEPLLSRSLYEMMVDGLSVCLPDDPDGSAKLMFSILECLPRPNLCTVLLLLDHLRLVASHSDRNRMAAAGLAVAFGPVLMCHADSVDVRRPIDVMSFLLEMWPDKRSPRLWFDATCNEVYRM